MFKKLVMATVVATLMGTSLVSLAQDKPAVVKADAAFPLQIAAVNLPYIMNEIPQSKEVSLKLQKEFGPRQQEVMKIEEEGRALEASLPTLEGQKAVDAQRKLAQLRSDYQLKAQALQEDQRKSFQDENVKLGRIVQTAIDAVAKERGLSMVLRGESIVYATNAVDISDEVINRVISMNGKKVNDGGKK